MLNFRPPCNLSGYGLIFNKSLNFTMKLGPYRSGYFRRDNHYTITAISFVKVISPKFPCEPYK
jgi:hypothetical protein